MRKNGEPKVERRSIRSARRREKETLVREWRENGEKGAEALDGGQRSNRNEDREERERSKKERNRRKGRKREENSVCVCTWREGRQRLMRVPGLQHARKRNEAKAGARETDGARPSRTDEERGRKKAVVKWEKEREREMEKGTVSRRKRARTSEAEGCNYYVRARR